MSTIVSMAELLAELKTEHCDWTNQELAEFYRVARALEQAGLEVEVDRGITDEGDPWFVFCHRETGEVISHFAKIGHDYLLANSLLSAPLRGQDFNSLIEAWISRYPAIVPPRAPRDGEKGGVVVLHPAAALTALVASFFVLNELSREVAATTDGTADLADAARLNEAHASQLLAEVFCRLDRREGPTPVPFGVQQSCSSAAAAVLTAVTVTSGILLHELNLIDATGLKNGIHTATLQDEAGNADGSNADAAGQRSAHELSSAEAEQIVSDAARMHALAAAGMTADGALLMTSTIADSDLSFASALANEVDGFKFGRLDDSELSWDDVQRPGLTLAFEDPAQSAAQSALSVSPAASDQNFAGRGTGLTAEVAAAATAPDAKVMTAFFLPFEQPPLSISKSTTDLLNEFFGPQDSWQQLVDPDGGGIALAQPYFSVASVTAPVLGSLSDAGLAPVLTTGSASTSPAFGEAVSPALTPAVLGSPIVQPADIDALNPYDVVRLFLAHTPEVSITREDSTLIFVDSSAVRDGLSVEVEHVEVANIDIYLIGVSSTFDSIIDSLA